MTWTGIPGSPRDARCGAVFGDGDGGDGGDGNNPGGGYSGPHGVNGPGGSGDPSAHGEHPSSAPGGGGGGAPGSGSGFFSSIFGAKAPGDPNQRSFQDVAYNGLHVGPGGWVGGTGPGTKGYEGWGGNAVNYTQSEAEIARALGQDPSTYAGRLNPSGWDGSFKGITDPNSNFAQSANGADDMSDPLGLSHIGLSFTNTDLKRLGLGAATIAGGFIHPAIGMAIAGMGGLAMGQNPGGVAGSLGGSMVNPILQTALAPLGIAGQVIGPFAGQALNYAAGAGGAAAYNAGYSAPAASGPNTFGGEASANTALASLSPAVTAPVNAPVAGPLQGALQNGGINLPILLGLFNRRRTA